MKILNLYAGIGGNRRLWGEEHEITSVEINPEIAKVYHKFFPQDKIIVDDAREYLLKHFREFDFIWSSPPCQSHSRLNNFSNRQGTKYPDMSLYEQVIFLDRFFKGFYVVENVIPYYKPLMPFQKIGRHIYFSNLDLSSVKTKNDVRIRPVKIKDFETFYGFDLSGITFKTVDKRQVLKNCVNPFTAKEILDIAIENFKKLKENV